MNVYANNVIEWVVADSVEDAREVMREHYRNWDCGPIEEADMDFEIVPGDKVLSLDEGNEQTTKRTAKEWAALKGRGFLMTTEY